MNGSGANVAGCGSCFGRCCREYRVEVNVADVRVLAAGTSLHPREFLRLYDSGGTDGFHLSPGGNGMELHLLRNPSTGAWTYFQIANNSRKQFQDKPAIALSGSNVLVSWTQFGSCSGVNVASPIKVAVFPQGASSVAPTTLLSVPGSTNSQGSSIQGDGSGGFWIAWEEYPTPSSTIGSIKLVHYTGTFGAVQTISPAAIRRWNGSRTNSSPSRM